MKNKLVIMGILIVLLTSCGGSSDDDDHKDLFSFWVEETSGEPLDLTGGSFSTPIPMAFYFVGGEQCNCDLTVLGDQSTGSYVINSCFYVSNSGSGDPGCDVLNGTGTYDNQAGILITTNSTGESSRYR